MLNSFDIYLTAGSQYRAVLEEFNAPADGSGQIAVLFSDGTADHAKINGIEIAMTAPSAPTSLAATAANGQIALQWAASADATSYRVQRTAISGGPYAFLASTGTTNYADAAVVGGVPYYYVVSAVGGGGQGANSAEASATPPVPQLSVNLGGSNRAAPVLAVLGNGLPGVCGNQSRRADPVARTTNVIQSSNGMFWLDLPISNRSQQFFRLSPN